MTATPATRSGMRHPDSVSSVRGLGSTSGAAEPAVCNVYAMVPVDARSRLTPALVRRGLGLPVGVGIRYANEGSVPPLHPLEESALGPKAIARRREVFALGRAAARDALGELGVVDVAIGRGEAGQPVWPPGIVGAISHSADVAVALVGRQAEYAGLGIDIEDLARGPSARAARLVCR